MGKFSLESYKRNISKGGILLSVMKKVLPRFVLGFSPENRRMYENANYGVTVVVFGGHREKTKDGVVTEVERQYGAL